MHNQLYSRVMIETPIGTLLAMASIHGIESVKFINDATANLPKPSITNEFDSFLNPLVLQMGDYFSGRRKSFELTIAPLGTPFQQKVWDNLHKIGYGDTLSYQEQSNRLGNPKAIRAVAAAIGKNPIAIAIPCHRVIGTNGKLTGYAGGLWRKQWLLEHEQRFSQQKGQMTLVFGS